MKKLALFFFLLLSALMIGKNRYTVSTDTIWYDCDYKVTTKENAAIYKIRPYIIKDRYIHVYYNKFTHKNSLISYSLDLYDSKLEGKRTYYYDNGNVNYVVHYKNNVKEGPYIEYYDDAKIYQQGEFRQDKKEGAFIFKKKDGSVFGKEYWTNGVKTSKPTKVKPLTNKSIANR
ncbi:hypothetical protein EZL74_08755 [Flavobacterium silvisoli]|uniref:Toxin-antitoxin system YwqK family antitoxin n=1 Tax=Flavobacterium silvisoli TaxID=2529433 RepID=A0A4Q9Z3I8_9FLAO|nr:hypothetical protein [Flavobacterium silvisoli]TBX68391.1 hypothetical protein EZL74_08755 [Flavobacterium silvisoli]